MKTYLLVDTANCFMRGFHSTTTTDVWTKLGLSLHITLCGIKSMYQKFNPDHVIFCAEGRSWRKDMDTSYKANRAEAMNSKSDAEKEEMKLFFDMQNDFISFIKEKTNASLLQDEMCEADDMIAGWIQNHPDDMHIIISTDTDFIQLLSENVQQYNPVQDRLSTIYGILNSKGKIAKDSKGNSLAIPEPEYELFYKCIRGDTGDNVFPAFPGVRENGTKNKIGIRQAFDDRHKKGFNWNSFMNSRWQHHDGSERIVKEEYAKNVVLVDLTKQPDFIKERINNKVNEAKEKKPVPMIGVHFLRFAAKYDLQNIQNSPELFVKFLGLKYNNEDTTNGNS